MSASSGLGLAPSQLDALAAAVSNLGNTAVPRGITGAPAVELSRIIDQSFVETFRLIMYACTGFAWLSALFAGLFLRRQLPERKGVAHPG